MWLAVRMMLPCAPSSVTMRLAAGVEHFARSRTTQPVAARATTPRMPKMLMMRGASVIANRDRCAL